MTSNDSRPDSPAAPRPLEVILSFDVEEHFRIEAATGLAVGDRLKADYSGRVVPVMGWLLDLLAARGLRATFFILGELARDHPGMIRSIHRAGHEVASHGWDHRRVLEMTPDEFREDARKSKEILEQITGEAVLGYRAPTFSIVGRTIWALDVLADLGMLYDSSIYPVRHDRYGIPRAPRTPFLARGYEREILEIPPATLRLMKTHVPVGGGGYFRLFPPALMRYALEQVRRDCRPAVAMLYFHPWEFDPDQPRLPLGRLSRFRTYVGIARSRDRLGRLLRWHRFERAIDVARRLDAERPALVTFHPTSRSSSRPSDSIISTSFHC